MIDIVHRVGIKAPANRVFKAVSSAAGIGGWWSQEASGGSKVGDTATFVFRSPAGDVIGTFVMELRELKPDQRASWRVKDGPPEWVGTVIEFDLKQEGDYTIVLFGHRGWREAIEFTAHCSMKWAVFMLSLRELVETGTGRPSPVDLKIDNWN